MISYEPFWETLKKKNITQYQLINTYGISAGQLSRMRANNHISTHKIILNPREPAYLHKGEEDSQRTTVLFGEGILLLMGCSKKLYNVLGVTSIL